jgi:hypothetical protein
MAVRYTKVGVSWGLVLLLCIFGVAGSVEAADARVGDTVEQVLDKMGRPAGEARSGELLLLTYDRGTVETYEGYVVKVDLVTPAQLRAQQEKAARAMARRAAEIKAQRDRRMAEGRKELARIEGDEAFAEKPAADQVAYWEEFKKKYPEVPLPASYTKARDALTKEEEAARKKREEEALAAQPEPTPRYSSHERRRRARRVAPGATVETPSYLVEYRRVGGNLDPSKVP